MRLKGKIVGELSKAATAKNAKAREKVEWFYEGEEAEVSRLIARGLASSLKLKDRNNESVEKAKRKAQRAKLSPYAAIYLYDILGVELANESASKLFLSSHVDYAKYITWRYLHERGFTFVGSVDEAEGKAKPVKEYKKARWNVRGLKEEKAHIQGFDGFLYQIDGSSSLYTEYWFGQKGIYKQNKGRMFFIDKYEAQYLAEKGILSFDGKHGKNKGKKKKEAALALSAYEKALYSVYKEWRDAGFVLKSGFKFGGDFRIYPASTKPGQRIHSKHILHVFPASFRTRVEDWSRSIRVCHSVRKTYILALPLFEARAVKPDFVVSIAGKGKGNSQESKDKLSKQLVQQHNPKIERFAVKVLRQSDGITGRLLHGLFKWALAKGLNVMLAIVDRETAITFYIARRIILESSSTLYYEIEWLPL